MSLLPNTFVTNGEGMWSVITEVRVLVALDNGELDAPVISVRVPS